jgi:transposase
MERKPYPSDDEWAFVAPYLTLMSEEAPQREHDLREVFHGLRWIVRTGAPWAAVYQQTRAPGGSAGVFEAIVADLRGVLRLAEGRNEQSSATILGSRTLQSSPESGHRAGYDGAKRRKGSKVHLVVDTLGHLLALHVTPANEQDRAQVAEFAEQVQEATADAMEVAFVSEYGKRSAAKVARSVWRERKAERPYLSLLLVKMALRGLVKKFATIAPKHVHRCVLNEGKIFLIETQR